MSLQAAAMAIPKYDVDKVVGAYAINNDTGAAGFEGCSGYVLPVAIYSIDGGTTWNDCGFYSMPSGLTLRPSYVNAFGDIFANIEFTKYGSPISPIFRIAILQLPNETTVQTPLTITNADVYHSKFGYMKIAKQGSFQVSTAAIHTTTIAHNLGYVPFFQVFIKDQTYTISSEIRRINADFGNAGSISEGVRVDTANIYISTQNTIPTQTITVYYRIYYEA